MDNFSQYLDNNNIRNTNISSNLYDIYINMIGNIENKNYIDISTFLYYFGLKHNTYSGYMQHDAQDFLRILLDDISKDFNKKNEHNNKKQINYTNINDKITSGKEFNNYINSIENSFVTDLFNHELVFKYTK